MRSKRKGFTVTSLIVSNFFCVLWVVFNSKADAYNYNQIGRNDIFNPFVNQHANVVMYQYPDFLGNNGAIFAQRPIFAQSPTTTLGKELFEELNAIKHGTRQTSVSSAVQMQQTPNLVVSPVAFGQQDAKVKKTKHKKSGKSRKKPKVLSSTFIQNKEYFESVPVQLGKAVTLKDKCQFVPTPIKSSEQIYFWKEIDYPKLKKSDYNILMQHISREHPFTSSSECLTLFDESFIAFKNGDLLISPEVFVGQVRQVGMQLRDSLLSTEYIVSTEDVCLAMRIILSLPHPYRNIINCKSAIIAAIRDLPEIENYELLDQSDLYMENKFKDINFSCKNTLKFQNFDPKTNPEDFTLKPNQLYKLFQLDLTPQDLQFYLRLALPHRKAALTVQNSYFKFTSNALLFDVAASIILLLNEFHEMDQSIEQCIEIVKTCVSLQEEENGGMLLNPSIAEGICKDLGITSVTKRRKVKYNSHTLIQLLKRLTRMKPNVDKGFIITTSLPSGKTLLPTSEYGFLKRSPKAEIWPIVGKIFSDGTISSSLIPACTGIPAFEFNRFVLLNTFIERYLAISGLGRIKLTIEDICLMVKYFISYNNLIKKMQKESSQEKAVFPLEDSMPLAIFTVTQSLNLELFTMEACREIYREFLEEEEASLKKVIGYNYLDKVESYYSKPPFSYNSNTKLKHLPKMMVNGNMFENTYTWKSLLNNPSCSGLKHHILNRIIMFIAFVLSYWRNNYPSEKIPFKSLFDVCNGFSNTLETYSFKSQDFVLFTEDWLFVKRDKLHDSILESIWNNFLIYERTAFPKNSEETESEYIQRVYHCSLIPEPLFIDDWIRIELPIRMDIAEFIKLTPYVDRHIGLLSNRDEITVNHVTLVKAFLETFFEEVYQYPVVVEDKNVLLLMDRRELEKKSMDELFFEIQSKQMEWNWLKQETASHAILELLEYLKMLKSTVGSKLDKKEPTNKDIFSSPRAVFVHGKWLIKAPQPVFKLANSSQKRALHGYPKYILNKARYIQAYFIKAFDRVLQFDLNIHIGDVVISLTNSRGEDERFIELLTERLSSKSDQSFITKQVVKEIYSACITFSFYRYSLKGALSEEQAFASPRVFYKPKLGWEFFPPNVPDFSKLLALSKIFREDGRDGTAGAGVGNGSELIADGGEDGHGEGSVKTLLINPYTWNCLKGFVESKKLEIWQTNRAVSMCAYFNHWLSYKFPKRHSNDIKVSACVNAIYHLKSMKGGYSHSEVVQIFFRYIGISYLKEGDIKEMLSAFNSYENIDKPNNMGKRQWLMSFYRIPQIEETGKNSLGSEFESLRFPTAPKLGQQSSLYGEKQQMRDILQVPSVFVPKDFDKDNISNFKELLEKFTYRFLKRIGINVELELEKFNFSISEVLNKCTGEKRLSLMDSFDEHLKEIDSNLPSNIPKRLSEGFYKFITLKFAGNKEEEFGEIIRRISSRRILTDTNELPFDIPLGIVSGRIDVTMPYNSHSFGEINFARLIIAYFNEHIIEQQGIRVSGSEGSNAKVGVDFISEHCLGRSFDIIKKGGVDLQQAISQACSHEFSWLTSKLLRVLISGVLTYCQINSEEFPRDQRGRELLKFVRERFNTPIVSYEENLGTWTMKDIQTGFYEKQEVFSSEYSTLESVGTVDKKSGIVSSKSFHYCNDLNVSQVNRLLAKIQYYRQCMSEDPNIVVSELEKLLDINIWCLSLRQEVPSMRSSNSNLLFNYFGINSTTRQTFEILEENFETLESSSWMERSSLKTYQQNLHDTYSNHKKVIMKINSLIKSDSLFCPKIVLENDLIYLQGSLMDNTYNRIKLFSAFSEVFFRYRYGIIFESKPVLVGLIVDRFEKIEESQLNVRMFKSMVPQATTESILSLFKSFNSYEAGITEGGFVDIKSIYESKLCSEIQGDWYFIHSVGDLQRDEMVPETAVGHSFTEQEVNRIQTIVAFINQSLDEVYKDKSRGTYVKFVDIALLLKAKTDINSFSVAIHYLYGILQDDMRFYPWFTVNVLKSIVKPFLEWESQTMFKVTKEASAQLSFAVPLTKIKQKYIYSPVGILKDSFHWYSWSRKPIYSDIVKRVAVLGDEIVHSMTSQERILFGTANYKHMYEIMTLYIQHFLQEVMNVIIPFNLESTVHAFTGKSQIEDEVLEFFSSVWKYYRDSYLFRGFKISSGAFQNPLVTVIKKQRFFPPTALPEFEYFDKTVLPTKMDKFMIHFNGRYADSKHVVNRISAFCAFLNLSFEPFITEKISENEILTKTGLVQIINGNPNKPIQEIKEKIVEMIRSDFPFYASTPEKNAHLLNTIDSYISFENEMINLGWSISDIYKKPLVVPLHSGYHFGLNLRKYIPNRRV
ncbi:hypothetical protein FG386_002460 [Cryptosporidium ryanae]|uniref:uncharacterized protein n=1 Tax=Cryptosporidium ryanae TaxID=515981 RepID=UPI00351A970C|nr:hypothetical protein FG386_002460 [Cryptosporidium ryanae]